MKETIKTGFVLFLVIFFALFFGMTKGPDELNLNFQLPEFKEEFSFQVYSSEYNGLYRNIADNGMYAMVGKNADGTYKVYFIKTVRSTKTVTEKVDATNVVDGKATFRDVNDVKLTIEFGKNELTIPKELGLGNEQLEGNYLKTKNIDVFSMTEFEF